MKKMTLKRKHFQKEPVEQRIKTIDVRTCRSLMSGEGDLTDEFKKKACNCF